jgi:sarcosine/dimethylglycine N-methyltransferase
VLVAAGKDLDHLRLTDLALLEDFHTMGRIATTHLADLAEIISDDEVLDAASGIGGTARYVAGRSGCHVVAVDSPRNTVRPYGGSTSLPG